MQPAGKHSPELLCPSYERHQPCAARDESIQAAAPIERQVSVSKGVVTSWVPNVG
jgi:hypothetical protein